MNRREALYSVSMMFGGTLVGAQLFLEGCGGPEADQATQVQNFFTLDEVALLDEIGETIIPAHGDVPGAKAVEIGKFMQTIVADCYSEGEQKIFREGLGDLQEKSQARYQQDFMDLSPANRQALLNDLNQEAQNQADEIPEDEK
ncbi:MAG: gluconate 2-dehydrogenase subunit 3 family protein, partial [Bacteroidota bacterium]